MILEATIKLEDTPLGKRYVVKLVSEGKEPLGAMDADFNQAMDKLQSLADSSRFEDRMIDAHYTNQR